MTDKKEEVVLYQNIRKGINSRARFEPLSTDISSIITDRNRDWYKSLFQYTEDHKNFLQENGTVSGITDTTTDCLFFDFDCKEDVDKARLDTIETAKRLINEGVDESAIKTYFTGSKGFSIEVTINERLNPQEFKNIVFNLAEDLETFDRVINDPNRIVRIPNTKHQKSGLYKIPLHLWELDELSINEIKEMSKDIRDVEVLNTIAAIPSRLKEYEAPMVEAIISEINGNFDTSSIDLRTKPKYLDAARWLLANGFFKTGQRNNGMLCLAATYKNVGYAEEHTKNLLNGVAEIQSKRTGEDQFPEDEIDLIINQVYSSTWRGGQFTTQDPQNWLYKYANDMGVLSEVKNSDILTISDVQNSFTTFVKNIDKNTIKTGIKSLDAKMPITMGTNVGIVGSAGSGKTAIALEILKNTSKSGVISVFASLDMHRNRLFEKLLYKVSDGKLSREEIYHKFQNGEADDLIAKVKRDYGNVWFYDRSSPSIEDIRNYVLQVEKTTGEKVKMVMIDYFERVGSEVNDETASSKKVSGYIQDMINDLDIAAITLVQPNKFSLGGGPDSPILSYTAIKGSSFLYQSFRSIISLWRPFYTPKTKEMDKYMEMAILKNDLGELDTFQFGWDGKRSAITELEDIERQELKEWLTMKEQIAAGKKDGDDNGWT